MSEQEQQQEEGQNEQEETVEQSNPATIDDVLFTTASSVYEGLMNSNEHLSASEKEAEDAPIQEYHDKREDTVEEETNRIEQPESHDVVKPPAPPRSPRPMRPSPRTNAVSTPEALSPLAKQFLDGKKVTESDPDVLADAVALLENERDQLIINGDFNESLRTQRAVDEAKAQTLCSAKRKYVEDELVVIQGKKGEVDQAIADYKIKMREAEMQINEDAKLMVENARQRQQRELDEYDSHWHSETKVRQYNRTSQQLRILRIQQQRLVNAKRFEEARRVCRAADELQRVETEKSHRQMYKDYICARELLQKRHSEEMCHIRMACDGRRNLWRKSMDAKMSQLNARMKNLEYDAAAASDPDRVWNLKHRSDAPVTRSGLRSPSKPKPANPDVSTFNTLKLPALPMPRKTSIQPATTRN